MQDRHAVLAIVGAAVTAMLGPVLVIWVSNAPQRMAAAAAIEMVADEEEEESPYGDIPGMER